MELIDSARSALTAFKMAEATTMNSFLSTDDGQTNADDYQCAR